jgi:hypothetical protein
LRLDGATVLSADNDNVIAFCKGETDAFGLLPTPSQPTVALVADLSDRDTSRTLLAGSAPSLAAVVAIGIGAALVWHSVRHDALPIPPVAEIAAHPAQEVLAPPRAEPVPAKAEIDRAQFEAWIATLTPHKLQPRPARPHHQIHRRPVPPPTPVSHPVTATDYGCPASLSPTICGRR